MRIPGKIFVLVVLIGAFLSACGSPAPVTTEAPPTPLPTPSATVVVLPKVTHVRLDRQDVPRYESLEMTVELDAAYKNPYDAREVRLNAVFTGPDGTTMQVPGFWDGNQAWKVRFTPAQVGEWRYQLTVTDMRGTGEASAGSFAASASAQHGWVLPGNQVNPEYSGRYLVHHDGTPFYGLGYCEALNILIDRYSAEEGVGLFTTMQKEGSNYVVWWPLYSMSPIKSNYNDYSAPNMQIMDNIVRDAEKKGIYLVFTVWDHPQLRGKEHPWGAGNWDSNNGFRKLGSVEEFFVSEESWAWQENFYRYIIARWGYSRAILMWQLVSEINGTNSGDQTDPWHKKINDYFVANDPYRHPTTASMSGDVDWLAGYQTTDAPQVHVYEFPNNDAVQAAEVLAGWTERMWQAEEKPNWVGEFGVTGNTYYPELFHNGIWAALGAGAAMTPAEWNSGGSWMRMSPEMIADMQRMSKFLEEIPLARLNPAPLTLTFAEKDIRAWGVAGKDGGLFWVQDFSLQGQKIEDVRKNQATRSGIQVNLGGLPGGTYTILPFNTWTGEWLAPIEITCEQRENCALTLPDFKADMAFRIVKR